MGQDLVEFIAAKGYGGESMSGLRNFISSHPLVIAWVSLAIVMVAMLLFAAKDVEFLPSQLAVLVVATIALAGACVWIISWEL